LFCAFYWPCRWQGYLALVVLGLLWVGGGGTVILGILPDNPVRGSSLVAALALAAFTLQYFLLRYAGAEDRKRLK